MAKVFLSDANIIYIGKITNDNNLKECAMYILEELEFLGIYITAVSRYSSVYFKFADYRLGSIRLADHKGRPYNYKWNLFCAKWKKTNTSKWTQHWFHVDDAYAFVQRIKQYAKTVFRSPVEITSADLPPIPPITAYEDR